MDLGIAGKTAVVTAASSGLGRAIAVALAQEGTDLVMFARREELLREVADDLSRRYHVSVLPVSGDMRNPADVRRLTTIAAVHRTGPDILILNTGRPPVPMREALDETEDSRWEEAYRTQLWGGILVLREIAPILVAKGGGRIVAVTSSSVKQPIPKHALSTVFRAGLTAYLKHLANEVADKGVTVNSVCPGAIATESLKGSYDISERAKRLPMKRVGTPEELAATVAFLSSRQAGFITGAALQVDGGAVASLI
jgi:3-oxoacyl-[acyl-carrier protein] reductase